MAEEASGPPPRPLSNCNPPPPLKLKGNSVEEWKMFKQMYMNYCIITQLGKHDQTYQQAVFLNAIGQEGMKLFNSLSFTAEEDNKDVKLIMEKFDERIIGDVNETYERYMFNKRDQLKTESVDEYLANLRLLAKSCNFCECLSESLVRDRLVLGIPDSTTRKTLLQTKNLTLKTAVDICRAAEATTEQLKNLGEQVDSVHKVYKTKKPQGKKSQYKKPRSTESSQSSKDSLPTITCLFCAQKHVRKKEHCPAWGKLCNQCKRKNHFAVCCKKLKRLHMVEEDEDDDSESCISETESIYCVELLNSVDTLKGGIYIEMLLAGKPTKFQVDSGSTVNVIPIKHLPADYELLPCNITLQMYNKSTLKALGRSKVHVMNPVTGKKYRVNFVVIEPDSYIPLFSRSAAEQMALITVNYENFKPVNLVKTTTSTEDLLSEYKDIFSANTPGTLPGMVHLEIEHDAKPIQCAPRKLPVSLKSRTKKALDEMVTQDILEPVDHPTEWCSRMSVNEKKSGGDLRICIDPRPLNKVLKRELYELPTLDDILHELTNAKIFSKFDLKSGYHHCILDEDSSYLTTMITPYGRYRWKRLPFGLKVSPEIFQKRLHQAILDINGVECIADDIIVFGSGETLAEAEIDHDKKLKYLLQRCKDNGIQLNKEKSVIKSQSINFMGHVITSNGLKPDEKKVEAITKLANPTNKVEVQRLLGTVTYLAKFLPRLSEVMEPIRKLTHKDAEWVWSTKHDKAMADVKKLVMSAPILTFYDPRKALVIQCDASKSGLGAVLLREGQPVAYTSRALTPTEERYAQIEKEALAIVFSLERFHQYTFGRTTIIESDHKPLESIVKKPLHRAPRRLQGMLLRMLNYDIEIVWKKGKEMHLADMLSRAYLPEYGKPNEFAQVNMLDYVTLGPEKLNRIKVATEEDEDLQMLKLIIQRGWPVSKQSLPNQVLPYFNIRDELSLQDGIVFRGERVIIPTSMRKEMKEAIHNSHLGIESSLRRARDCLFWPGMTADIKQHVSLCDACRTYETQNKKETLVPHEIPTRPWEKVGTDLFTWDRKDYLITVDYLSNFWEIDRLYDQTSKEVIKKLKAQFSRYGIPSSVVSDNGPQYTSSEFHAFAKRWDFEHYTSSPGHSQANGKAESAVKSAKRLLSKCKKANSDPYMAVLEWRNTPTQGVGSSPVQRLQGRRTRTLLPTASSLLKPRGIDILDSEREKMKKLQTRKARHYNETAKDLPTLEEGDTVRMRPFKIGVKEWKKAVVNEKLDDRSYEIETSDGTVYRRNRRDLKKTQETPPIQNQRSPRTVHKLPTENRIKHSESIVPPKPLKQSIPGTKSSKPATSPVIKSSTQVNKHHQVQTSQKSTNYVPLTTRSGRRVKAPTRLGDYVVT